MRGHIRKRGSTWTVVLYLGYGPDGKKKYKWIGGFRTKREAEKHLASLSDDIHSGTFVDPSREPFANYLQRWLEHKQDYVRPRTIEIYGRIIRTHIVPTLGRLPLSEIKPFHLRQLYAHLQHKKGLSARYVSQIHSLLHDALDTALKWELVTRNAADHVEPPKPAKTRFTVWSLDEVRRFLSAPEVRSNRFYLAFLLALTTGMRIGEILALRWEDVDLDAGVLYVRRTVTMRGGIPEFGPPKSESGERAITIPREVVDVMRKHRANQAQEKLLMGTAYRDRGLVITRTNGNVVQPQFLRKKFAEAVEQVGLPKIRFHDLRHTHSSILLELGENMKTLQERLGHATYAITADTYTHVTPKLRTRPAQLLSEALFGRYEDVSRHED